MSTLPNISPELIKKYQEEISKNSSEATSKRKTASLNKFFDWAEDRGHVDINPMPAPQQNSGSNYAVTKTNQSHNVGLKTWAILGTTFGIIILIFLLTWKLGSPIEYVKNFAAGTNNNPTAEVIINNQNILPSNSPESTISASPAANGPWNLYANLKLTDEGGYPEVGSKTITFKVYNTENGGESLFTSDPQTVTTDSNGSALISLDQVPSDLFFQNNRLFLEPVIGSASASTRIPVSTANVAANLGGYFPADPTGGAGELTIPVIDGNGSLNLASQSPAINGKSGNLLVQGQAVTVKTVDGGNGNIEINPDGSGIAHFLFEGSKGNFLNAQAPNLNKGSLYYGIVANNSTGYDLLKLQNGSKAITRFSVDALGNTIATGNINAGGSLQTSGVSRVTSTGKLENITGYSQNSGNFTMNQNPGDFASITKTGTALNNAVTMTLDERGDAPSTSYSTLVLNRYNAYGIGMALLVSNGNAQFDGLVKLGNFSSNPGNIGTGSLVYNTTDNKVYYWNGTAWTAFATGASSFSGAFTDLTSGTNTTAAMVVGTGGSLTFSGTGTITASDVSCTGCVANTELANSSITVNSSGILSGGGTVALGGTLNLAATEADTLDSVTGRGATTVNTITIGNLIDSGLTASKPVFTDANKQLTSTGTLGADQGGTGFGSYTVGDMLYADTTSTLAKLADVATGKVLRSGGIGVIPAWGDAVLSITGTANQITASAGTGDVTLTIPSDFRAPGTVNAVTGIATGAVAGTQRIDASGNLTNIGTTQLNGVTYTWPAADAALSGYVLSSNASGQLSWAAASSAGGTWTIDGTGVIYPNNQTVDALIGGTATASAKFAFTGVNGGLPTASISGNIAGVSTYLTGNGTLATTNGNHLTIGGATTGGVDFGSPITSGTWNGNTIAANYGGTGFSSYAVGDLLYADTATTLAKLADVATGNVLISGGIGVAPSWDKVTLGTHTTGNYVSSLAGTANQITASASTGDITLTIPSDFRAPGTVNATTGLATGATAGTQRIDASGNLTNIGTTQINGVTYTWPGADAVSSGYVLSSNAAGQLSWVDNGSGGAGGTWTIDAAGVIYPNNQTVDALIGGTATSSAKFAFTGVSSGLPTASISGNIAGVNTYLTGNGNLATTNMQDLTLGGSSTGNVVINSRGSSSLTANGANLTAGGTFTLPNSNTLTGVSNYLQLNNGVSVGGGTTYYFDSSGNINAAGITGTSITDTGLTANKPVFTDGSKNLTSSGTLLADQGGTGFSSYAVGDLLYADTTTTLAKLADVATGNVLISGGIGVAPSWDKVTLGTHTTGNYVSTLTGTANQIDVSASTGDITLTIPSDFRAPGTVNATTGLATGAVAGTQRIDASGNLTNIGTTQFNGITYTWPGADAGVSGYVLSSDAAGQLSWIDNGAGSSGTWTIDAAGVIYPNNQTVDALIGGTATSSAKFAFTGVSSGLPTASISGDIAGVNTYLTGNGNLATTNMQDLTLGGSSTGNVVINSRGSIALTANGLNLTTGGNLALTDTYTLQAGGATGTAYNVFANSGESPVGAAAIAAITSDNDLFVGGDFQAAGTIYDSSGNVIAGYWSQSGSDLYPTSLTNMIGIGTNSPLSRLSVVNNPAGGSLTGKAAFLVDQYENEDILTASASGQTKLALTYDGTLKLYNATSSISNDAGDITIDAASNFISFSGDSIGNINDLTAAGEIVLAGGSASTGCTITNSTGDLTCSALGTFGGALQAGTITTPTAYSRFGTATTDHGFTTAQDVLVGGNLEVDGVLYLDGRIIANPAGTSTIIFAADPSAVDNPNILDNGVWWINNNVNNGMASLMVNQEKGGDIFSASSSGTTKFTIHNDGAITLAGMSSTTNTAEGTVYYDTDVDHLYLRTGDSAFHRLAMDMTKYATTAANIANLSYVEVTHNQNTNDMTLTGWVKNTITNLWEKITDKSVTMKQSLQNEFDTASASGLIRTQTRLTDIELEPSVDVGTGADGAITVSSSTSINAAQLISGRSASCPDAVNYSVTALTATTATLSTTPVTGCLVDGDEILLINLQGTSTAYGNMGNYETLRVSGNVTSSTVTFKTAKTKFYGDGAGDDTNIGTAASTQRVMLQRVPNYTTVTVNSSQNFTPTAWDGTKGGVIFFRATGAVATNGTIHANAMGYRGGTGGANSGLKGLGGESFCDVKSGGDGGNYNAVGSNGLCGGGGGGGSNVGALYAGGTGTASLGGAGGGGGGSLDTANGAYGGGGGGGGYGSLGAGGTGGTNGTDGGTNSSGNGGAGTDTGRNRGGGGGGGGTYGYVNLRDLLFGASGGGGGSSEVGSADGIGGDGGSGGGIVYISANTITVSGGINSDGEQGGTCGGTYVGGGGGGGAGGSVKLMANTLALGSSLVDASAGGAGACGIYPGGAGGSGRTAIYYTTSYSGATSTPAAYYSVQPYYPYGMYHSGVIATPNAVTLSDLRWEASPSAWGKIEFQTRTGNSDNPTDGTWEAWKPAVASTNYLSLQDANTHTDWTGTSATVADGTVTRNVDQFEDEDEGTAGNTTKFVNTAQGGGYAEATITATDISAYDYITAWVYATASGNTVTLGFGESAATEQVESVTIDATNTWQKVYWDLSDIVAASRDQVTKLRITNLNNPWNTIHFDNIKAEKAMTVSSGTPIASTPNNYLQYRIIFTTTNTSFQPQVNNIQFSYNNSYKIDQTDTNNVRLYNYTGQNQEIRLDAVVFGADLAEYYAVNNQNIGAADVVAVTGDLDDYGVPILRKSSAVNDPGLIGVISTKAGQTLGIEGDDRRLLALAGRVPVKMASTSAIIKSGDQLTASTEPGRAKKASIGEKSIGTALESWSPDSGKDTIMILVGNGNFLTPILSDLNAYILNAKVNAEGLGYQITDSLGETVNNVGIFSQVLIANITAGAIETTDFVSENLISKVIKTGIISPLADETDITVKIGSESTPSGKLAIQNFEGDEVASIDSAGNATFSGTLYADNIKSKSLDEIQALLSQVQTDQYTLFAATASAELTASGSASIAELITNDMYVTGQATLTSASIADSLTLGSDLVIGLGGNTINSLSTPLQIQSLAMAPVEIMGGLISIDTKGNMQIAGNLYVAGRIKSSGLTLKDDPMFNTEASQSASLLSLQDVSGNQVSSVDASGSANFNSIAASQFVVAAGTDATNSAVINGVITTNATAGSATIQGGISEITIKNPKVTDYTLVYVTPTSPTQNNVLYVKSKSAGQFIVGFTNAINTDTNFNWWIVQIQN